MKNIQELINISAKKNAIQENIKLVVLCENLDKMVYYPAILIEEKLDKGEPLTEAETTLYYTLKLSAEIIKSYMEEKGIPVSADNYIKENISKNLAHSEYLNGIFDLMKLYELRDDERIKTGDYDFIAPDGYPLLNEYRSRVGYNHAVYFDAYTEVERLKKVASEEEFFNEHPLLNADEHFMFIWFANKKLSIKLALKLALKVALKVVLW